MTGTLRTRRSVLRTGSAALAVAVAGCLGGGDGGGGTTVGMTDSMTFEPDALTVETGTTVTWNNDGSVPHTVTAYEESIPEDAAYFASGDFESEEAARDGFKSGDGGLLDGGESYEHTFETAGSYEYFCIPHEQSGMTGTITVE